MRFAHGHWSFHCSQVLQSSPKAIFIYGGGTSVGADIIQLAAAVGVSVVVFAIKNNLFASVVELESRARSLIRRTLPRLRTLQLQ